MDANYIASEYEQLNAGLAKLTSLIDQLPFGISIAAAVPPVSKGMENEPVTRIELDALTGEIAKQLTSRCYRDLHIDPRYSQKAARRTVGIHWLSPLHARGQTEQLKSAITDINTHKANIEHFVIANFKTRKERFEIIHEACPGVMTLQLYRQIKLFCEQHVSSVRFSWQRKESLSTPNKEKLLAKIGDELQRSGPDHQYPLEQLVNKIIMTPQAQLRERRPVKVQPAANIVMNGKVKTVTAPMPIIIIQDQQPTIEMIGDYSAAKVRRTRSDKIAAKVLGTFGGVSIECFPGPANQGH